MLSTEASRERPAIMERRLFLGLLPALLLAPDGFCSPPNSNFSGTWKQSNERCVPKRTGDVTLHIEHRDPFLTVETTALRGSAQPRHAVQRYTTDGKTSVSTGADGDEFHTSIVWNGQSLVFSVEEHEDGRILLSKETWTLIENEAALQREREDQKAPAEETRKQTLIYLRQSPGLDG
jgi:hypothetical protein